MLLLALACASPADPSTVPLRWVRGWDGETWEIAERGLYWQLAGLGAIPPADGSAITVTAADDDGALVTLDLDRLGLSDPARAALGEATAAIAGSDEVARFGGLDLGQLVLLTLYSPWDYYAITGACPTLSEWQERRVGDAARASFAVTESLVSGGERLILVPGATGTAPDIALEAVEGEGSSVDGTFTPRGAEVIDVLPSGAFRYAAYDAAGDLEAAVDPAISVAGQPGGCMWCHEETLEHALAENTPVAGSLTQAEFVAAIAALQDEVEAWRAGMQPPAPIWDHEVHTYGELLTETWLQPTPARLSREWGIPEADVRAALDPASLTTNPEYPEQGDVTTRVAADAAFRRLVDPLYAPLPTLPSARDLDPADLPRPDGIPLACP